MEFVINNIIGRSHCNMTALRFILLTETLVCSVHETADLTCDLFRRIGIRLDGFSSQLVTSDDAADLRKLNSVLLGHLEDNLGISKFAALIDDQASQLTGLHAEMSASKPHHDFSRALAEKGDLAKNGFLLLGLLPCLLSLELLLEFPDGFALNVHAFGIVCIISDDILVGVCVFRRNAGSLNRAVERDDLEIIGGKHPEAVVHHVVADRITILEDFLEKMPCTRESVEEILETVSYLDLWPVYRKLLTDCAALLTLEELVKLKADYKDKFSIPLPGEEE